MANQIKIKTTAEGFVQLQRFDEAAATFATLTEVNAIETAVGLNTDGTLVAFSGNHTTGSADFKAAVDALDTEIGADLTAVVRTNNPVVAGDPLNDNISKLDNAVGVTPTSTNHISAAAAVNANLSSIDAEIGADLTAAVRTNSPVVAGDPLNDNIAKLDVAIGTDAQLSGAAFVTVGNSVNQMIKELSDSLGISAAGLSPKAPCVAATTDDLDNLGNGTWVQAGAGAGATLTAGTSGTTTFDGRLLANGERVLVKDQATASENGIYVVSADDAGSQTVLTRATDFDGDPSSEVFGGAFTWVDEGSVNVDAQFAVTSNGTIVVDTDAIDFGKIASVAGLGAIQTEVDNIEAGAGLNTDGTFTADATTNFLTGATDLQNESKLLDTQVKTNQDEIALRTEHFEAAVEPGSAIVGDLWIDTST